MSGLFLGTSAATKRIIDQGHSTRDSQPIVQTLESRLPTHKMPVILAIVTDTWTLFDRLADRYDQVIPFFTSFAAQLLDILDPAPGTRLLDIGTGRGAIAIAAAVR